MTDELKAFVRDAVSGMGVGRFDEPRPLDETPPDFSDELAPSDADRDEAPEPSVPSDSAAYDVANEAIADWTATLDEDDRARAMSDPEFAAKGFKAFLGRQTDEKTAATLYNAWLGSGDDGEAADVDVVADAMRDPSPGRALARAVYRGDIEVEGGDAVSWLLWAAGASPEEWRAYAEEAGLPVGLRPGHGDLPPAVEMERVRRHFAQMKDDIASGRRGFIE